MKKMLIIGGAIAGALFLAKRFAPKMGTIDWEQKFAAMPDNAPPKWMFRNINEIHDNTERIIELLQPHGTLLEPRATGTTDPATG